MERILVSIGNLLTEAIICRNFRKSNTPQQATVYLTLAAFAKRVTVLCRIKAFLRKAKIWLGSLLAGITPAAVTMKRKERYDVSF